jgi:hypothetical protein
LDGVDWRKVVVFDLTKLEEAVERAVLAFATLIV